MDQRLVELEKSTLARYAVIEDRAERKQLIEVWKDGLWKEETKI